MQIAEILAATYKYNIDEISPLAAAVDSAIYAQKHMSGKPRLSDRLHLLSFALSQLSIAGLFLEFGVHSGTTVNHIANTVPDQKVFGFDSFEGLPEAWGGAPAGTFAQPELPQVRLNVELVQGWFDRTLPPFVERVKGTPVAFLHIDCDLYSSTQVVLMQLRDRIVKGTVIVFDEYFNYPDWRKHEYLA
jgi:hypothetical protein